MVQFDADGDSLIWSNYIWSPLFHTGYCGSDSTEKSEGPEPNKAGAKAGLPLDKPDGTLQTHGLTRGVFVPRRGTLGPTRGVCKGATTQALGV